MKRLVSPIRINKPEEIPDTTYKPHLNPKKNVVLSIYERGWEALTLPENSADEVTTCPEVSVRTPSYTPIPPIKPLQPLENRRPSKLSTQE